MEEKIIETPFLTGVTKCGDKYHLFIVYQHQNSGRYSKTYECYPTKRGRLKLKKVKIKDAPNTKKINLKKIMKEAQRRAKENSDDRQGD